MSGHRGRIVRKNDLFCLGAHRLLCADSRDLQDVRRVVGRRGICLIFARPPYFNQRSYSHWRTYEAYLRDMEQVIQNCVTFLAEKSVVAWLVGRGSTEHKDHAAHHSILLEAHSLLFQDAIAWVKPGANYSIKRSCHIPLNGFYYPAFRWETLLIYRTPGRPPRMSISGREYMSKHHTDVWEIPWVTQQVKHYGHPSVSPVEIPRRCMFAYTRTNSVVLDPFGGSGTTLIAAEQIGRTCLLIERKPAFCAEAIRRWEGLTGKKARRL